jgi:hypothetical protein
MQAEIDRAAGIIWRYLNEHGGDDTRQAEAGNESGRPLLMGIGWLAREDKLSFTQAGKIVRLSLRTSQTA